MAYPTTQDLKLWSAYAILSVFSVSALILICIIIHLIYIAKRNRSTRRAGAKNKKNNKQMLVMIWITLLGIISFEIALLLIISLVIQIIMMKLHVDNDILYKYYDSSFHIVSTFITIFDNFGHLSMILVFIIRLKRCFKDSMFGFSKKLLRFLYGCLVILAIFSFGIDIQTAIHSYSNKDIVNMIITQMIWEILIECMELCLLFLFLSKLSQLIVLSLTENELSLIITHIISNKRKRKPSIPEPTELENERVFSVESDNTEKNTLSPKSECNINTLSPKSECNDGGKSNNVICEEQEKQIIYLVNMMTKMTVLVIIAIFISFVSLVGNKIIKVNELRIVKEHEPNIQQIWLFILPVMDKVIVSICLLYLPFNFTKGIYKTLCIKCDVLCLKKLIGKILKYRIKNSLDEDVEIETRHDGEEETDL